MSPRAETLFQQGIQMSSKLEKSLSQVFHFRYAKFHHYQTKNEAEAISHYTKVGSRGRARVEAKKNSEVTADIYNWNVKIMHTFTASSGAVLSV